MSRLRTLPADDPGLAAAVARMLDGGPAIAPLPADPGAATATLAMLRPDEPLVETDAGLVVGTSGSTGEPKGVVLSRAAIRAGVAATHARLGGTGNWTLAVPAHYVAGILVVARAVAAGTSLFAVDADLHDLPDQSGLDTGSSERNYLSLVPTQLVRALDRPDVLSRLARYDAILLGGAAADPGVLAHARAAGLTIITTYGMSETSGGCVYDGVPLDGVTIDLHGRGDPEAGGGRVSITGPVVFSGYRLRPDLTAKVLDGATLHTRDRARWDGSESGPSRLEILGRIDDVVVSGGVNVDLAAVEKVLKELDPQGAVVGVRDPEWGTRIIAAVTIPTTLPELRARLHTLEPAAKPLGLLRHPRLPHTSSGKIDRQELIAWWTAGPAEKEVL
ncbi:AMP-binding protein [Granulicoccus sp. GXG6511]|uniref:AMP-binding protein n=1 Tax=Granulicoccus sp. GXG6511 TaxID=3381351 RepID=UPI003D7D0550